MEREARQEVELKYLDNYLLLALDHLRENWFRPNMGSVACVLVDGDNLVVASNSFLESGKLVHAERNAFLQFNRLCGPTSEQAVAVITLSPCIVFSKSRQGTSCAELLLERGVKRIHFGFLHEKQGPIETYKELGFNPTLTENLQIRATCRNLISLLEKYLTQPQAGKKSWIEMKQEVENTIFTQN